MKAKTSSDVGTNFATLMKLLEPAIKFILEHDDESDRSVLFSSCIHILKTTTKLTPVVIMGTLFSAACSTDRAAHDRAKVYSKLGIQAVADR